MPHPVLTAAVVAIGVIAAAVYYVCNEHQINGNSNHRNDDPWLRGSPYRIPPSRVNPTNSSSSVHRRTSAAVDSSRSRKRKGLVYETCSICLDLLTTSLATLDCNHVFHENCIELWFKEAGNKNCPLCRHPTDVITRIQ